MLQLKVSRLEVCKQKTTFLTKKQVNQSFSTLLNRNEYNDYLSSGLVDIFIVKGNCAIQKAKEIKNKIRDNYSVNSKMINNLIHSSDEGLEYYLQFTCCFPEHDIKHFSGYADMLATKGDESELMQSIICDPTVNMINVKQLLLLVQPYEIYFNHSRIQCLLYSKEICHIASFNCIEQCVEAAKERQGFVAIDLFGIEVNSPTLSQMQKKGVIAAVAFDSRYCLDYSKDLQEIIEECGLLAIGGSFTLSDFGLITVSENKFIETLKKGDLL
jgi:nucleoside diphosphate kinase